MAVETAGPRSANPRLRWKHVSAPMWGAWALCAQTVRTPRDREKLCADCRPLRTRVKCGDAFPSRCLARQARAPRLCPAGPREVSPSTTAGSAAGRARMQGWFRRPPILLRRCRNRRPACCARRAGREPHEHEAGAHLVEACLKVSIQLSVYMGLREIARQRPKTVLKESPVYFPRTVSSPLPEV